MKRTQIGWVFIIVVALVDFYIIRYQSPNISYIIAAIITLITLPNFCCLTIKVDNEYVTYYFGVGLIKNRYKITSINSCKSISYIPFGWGVRFKPGVIIFNVSGNKAIELVIKGKSRKVWIGTNKPDELSNYIKSKLTNDEA